MISFVEYKKYIWMTEKEKFVHLKRHCFYFTLLVFLEKPTSSEGRASF